MNSSDTDLGSDGTACGCAGIRAKRAHEVDAMSSPSARMPWPTCHSAPSSKEHRRDKAWMQRKLQPYSPQTSNSNLSGLVTKACSQIWGACSAWIVQTSGMESGSIIAGAVLGACIGRGKHLNDYPHIPEPAAPTDKAGSRLDQGCKPRLFTKALNCSSAILPPSLSSSSLDWGAPVSGRSCASRMIGGDLDLLVVLKACEILQLGHRQTEEPR